MAATSKRGEERRRERKAGKGGERKCGGKNFNAD
jgi:hypothetical protein